MPFLLNLKGGRVYMVLRFLQEKKEMKKLMVSMLAIGLICISIEGTIESVREQEAKPLREDLLNSLKENPTKFEEKLRGALATSLRKKLDPLLFRSSILSEPTSTGNILLYEAIAQNADANIIKKLLEEGIIIYSPTSSYTAYTIKNFGDALSLAAQKDKLNVVLALAEFIHPLREQYKHDPNNEYDPIFHQVFLAAIKKGNATVADFFVENVPGILIPTRRGENTALHLVVRGFEETEKAKKEKVKGMIKNIINKLLEKGADPDQKNREGKTPIDLAKDKEIKKMLREKSQSLKQRLLKKIT